MPATEEILVQIAGGAPGFDSSRGRRQPPPLAGSPSREVDPQSRALLEAALAEYIGPMASIVCDSDLAMGQNLDTAITTLAKAIPDPENGRRFAEEVRAQLA